MTIRPAIGPQVMMACIGAPLLILGVVGSIALWAEGDLLWAFASGAVLVGLGCWCVLEVSTVRLHLSSERLWLSRYWHTRWEVERDNADLRRGEVGDGGILHGLQVRDRQTNRNVGEIIAVQFNAKDLDLLQEMLRPAQRAGSS